MCRTKIQRTDECNHMTCLLCRYEFCYFCYGSANGASLHFSPGMGCGANLYGSAIRRGDCFTILRKIFFILGCIILYPLAAGFGPSIYLTVYWVSNLFKERGACARFIVYLLLLVPFSTGLVMNILWIPMALLGLPIAFVLMNMT